MTKTIEEHEGKKYLREIHSACSELTVNADVYNVLEAFEVTCPATAHAVKKLLCGGRRDRGSRIADLYGAEAAISRAIELELQRMNDKSREDAK